MYAVCHVQNNDRAYITIYTPSMFYLTEEIVYAKPPFVFIIVLYIVYSLYTHFMSYRVPRSIPLYTFCKRYETWETPKILDR